MNKPHVKRRKIDESSSSTNEMTNIDIIPPIKIEPSTFDEVIIKMEPVDTYGHNEMYSMPEMTTTQRIYNAENSLMDDEEIGLISELEFIKNEIDVDESMLEDFRSEMLRESQRQESLGQPVFLTLENDSNIALCGKRDKLPKNNVDGQFMRKKKGIIVCPFCEFKTTTRNRSYFLKDHLKIHTGENPFNCRYCEKKFRLSQMLHYHVRNVHPTKPIFRCDLCRIIIYDQETFDEHKYVCVKVRSFECHLCRITYQRLQKHKIWEHMRSAHTGEQVFQCTVEQCTEKFVTNAQLSHHLQRVHPNTMTLICSVCHLRFDDDEKFVVHERNCKTRTRYQCHLCGYSYLRMTLSCLKMHMRKHTGDKPFKCSYCSKSFPREEALKLHKQRAHYKLQCRRCHRRCRDAKTLEIHEMYCKRRRYECYMCGFSRFGISFSKFRRHVVIKHTGESGIKCLSTDCPKRFSSKDVFGAHIMRHHPDQLKYLCLICNQNFKNSAEKKLHQNKCTRKRIECYLCFQTTLNMKKLRNHMVHSHTGEKKYHCDKCSKSFQTERNLKIHIKSHTINKKDLPKCSFCQKRFIDLKYQKKHEFQCRKSYECYACKQTFPNYTELYGNHFRVHLGKRPYQCKHCPKTIASIRCYKLHVINYHLASYRFKCIQCNGIITTRTDFRFHQKNCMKPIRQSANVVYFTCSLCGSELKRLPELRDHIIFNKCKKHPQLQQSSAVASARIPKRKSQAK